LIWRGYLQWCDDGPRQQRQSCEELGAFLRLLYSESRRHKAHPTHEIEHPLAWARPDPPDLRQSQMTYAGSSADPSAQPPAETEFRLPDDGAGVVVCLRRRHGYAVGTLEEARARFEVVMGPLDPPWRQPVE
jgi:hypothetical protein